MQLQVSIILGAVFGVLAATLAFVIVFDTYRRQQFQARWIWREALLAAAFAFTVFLFSSVAIGYALAWPA